MALVFTHFVASAVAVVTILQTDLLLLKRYDEALTRQDVRRIHQAKPIVTAALWVLWLTGLAICVLGYLQNPDYLLNQKLMMKLLVVEILTLNGLFLHEVAFRHVKPGRVMAEESPITQRLLVLMGCLSSTSWLFACFLGIARPLNNLSNFYVLLTGYLVILLGSVFVGWAMTHWMARRHARQADGIDGIGYGSGYR
ncbi:MAG: hypothetical protein Q4D91_00280 [Lautropia sp.]|nr:hypothetical protein [Lautropia sp.]